jgi:hypothetical protein
LRISFSQLSQVIWTVNSILVVVIVIVGDSYEAMNVVVTHKHFLQSQTQQQT